MQAVDDSVMIDEKDVINSVAFEKLVRRAYGLEKAYEDCYKIEDWKRPDGKKSWVSKVKWDLCDRYDLRGKSSQTTKVLEADEEARQAMERDAAFMKYYTKSRGPNSEE
jgi:glutathionylspermidine synthase